MAQRESLPNMNFIRREIPIADVAEALGIRVTGRNGAHCWRVGAHQNGDRTASMSFHRNRVQCHVCDPRAMSTIDLVIKFQELDPSRGLKEATEWICARWSVPMIPKNVKLARRERWATSPVGRSSFPLEDFIRSGVWAALDDPARAVLPVLFCFAERGTVCVSYRGLARYSGLGSFTTIAKAFQQLKRLGILEALPRLAGGSFREPSSYRFTLDGGKFQAALSETHARLKLDSGAERELLAQARATLPDSGPPKPQAPYLGTVSLIPVTRTQVHALENVACTFSSDSESRVVSEDSRTENKGTYESARFNPCNTNSAEFPNQTPEDAPLASDSQDSGIDNKDACTSAHFSTVKCEESAPAEVENRPARWKAPATVPSQSELAEKLARSIAAARRWPEIASPRAARE